jgi:hypothetical protein
MFGLDLDPTGLGQAGGIIGGIISAVAAVLVALIARNKENKTKPGSDEWYRKKIDEHDKAITALRAQNSAQAKQISALQAWKASALQYITILLAGYTGKPPDPPNGFTTHQDVQLGEKDS